MIDIKPMGVGGLMVSFEQIIDPQISKIAKTLAEELELRPLVGQKEVVVSYASLGVYWELAAGYGFAHQKKEIQDRLKHLGPVPKVQSAIFEIPTVYNGQDLAAISEYTGLDTKALIALHASQLYRVYAIGFLPGFAYMGALDRQLEMPRKPKPLPVCAGAVAIAGAQTAVYPQNSPGGWWVLGHTDFVFFDQHKGATLAVGDSVRFVPK
jgi:inhibitor of KinA